MQSARINALGTYVGLGLLIVPIILATIGELRDAGSQFGIPDEAFVKASLVGAVLIVLLKGAQAVSEIISQYEPKESASRHGIATYVGLATMILPAIGAVIANAKDSLTLLGVSPETFGKGSMVGAALLVILKGAQATVEIVAQRRWIALEEPIPSEGGADEPA